MFGYTQVKDFARSPHYYFTGNLVSQFIKRYSEEIDLNPDFLDTYETSTSNTESLQLVDHRANNSEIVSQTGFGLTAGSQNPSEINNIKVTLFNTAWTNHGHGFPGHAALVFEKNDQPLFTVSWPEQDTTGRFLQDVPEAGKATFYVDESDYTRFQEWYQTSKYAYKADSEFERLNGNRNQGLSVISDLWPNLDGPGLQEQMKAYGVERNRSRRQWLKNNGDLNGWRPPEPVGESGTFAGKKASEFTKRPAADQQHIMNVLATEYDPASVEYDEFRRFASSQGTTFDRTEFDTRLEKLRPILGFPDDYDINTWFRNASGGTYSFLNRSAEIGSLDVLQETEVFKSSPAGQYELAQKNIRESLGLAADADIFTFLSNANLVQEGKVIVPDDAQLESLASQNKDWKYFTPQRKTNILASLKTTIADMRTFESLPIDEQNMHRSSLDDLRTRFSAAFDDAKTYIVEARLQTERYGAGFDKYGYNGKSCIDCAVDSINRLGVGGGEFYPRGYLPRIPDHGIGQLKGYVKTLPTNGPVKPKTPARIKIRLTDEDSNPLTACFEDAQRAFFERVTEISNEIEDIGFKSIIIQNIPEEFLTVE